mgnify:CR=1 FL=1
MAEIRIEKKPRDVWAWMIPMLLLLASLWWFFGRGSREPVLTNAQADTRTDSAAAYSSASPVRDDPSTNTVADFVAFVSDSGAWRGDDQQHAYTAEGIRRLSMVLDGAMPGNTTTATTATMRAQANAIENSAAESSRHADMARTAFIAAAAAFDSLPAGRLPPDAATRVRDAANRMRSEPDLPAQKDRIAAFFLAASRAVQDLH